MPNEFLHYDEVKDALERATAAGFQLNWGGTGWRIQKEGYGSQGQTVAELKQFLNGYEAAQSEAKPTLSEDDVEWVVNDAAELGVRVNGQCFFLYKGESLIYREERRPVNGGPMRVRRVMKREFGEVCRPLNLQPPDRDDGSAFYFEGGDWEDMEPRQ